MRSRDDKRPQATSEMISTETNGLGTTLNSVKRTKRRLSNIISKTSHLHLTRKASNSLAGSSSVLSPWRCSDSSKAIQVSKEMAAARKTTTSEDTIVIEWTNTLVTSSECTKSNRSGNGSGITIRRVADESAGARPCSLNLLQIFNICKSFMVD